MVPAGHKGTEAPGAPRAAAPAAPPVPARSPTAMVPAVHKVTKSLGTLGAVARDTQTIAVAAGATVVAVAFAASLTERWVVRRRPHELAWAVALGLFACGSLSL